MARKKKYNFVTLGEQIQKIYTLDSIAARVAELNRINSILNQNFVELRNICHCGAIDYANDLLVLYVINNGAFYKVNQLVPDIQDVLAVNQVYLSKLLVKVRPEKYFKPIVKPQLDPLQHAMLEKFAAAINRPDLIKSASSSAQDENSPELEDWQIQL